MSKRTKIIRGLSIDHDVSEGISKLAKKERRGFSNYVNFVLAEHIKGETKWDQEEQRKLDR